MLNVLLRDKWQFIVFHGLFLQKEKPACPKPGSPPHPSAQQQAQKQLGLVEPDHARLSPTEPDLPEPGPQLATLAFAAEVEPGVPLSIALALTK